MALTQVSTDGVKNDAITKTKIPANQIEASELADNAVDTNAIANNAVTAGKLASGVTDLSNDTSPQLGGGLASNGNHILMADSDEIRLGTGEDLQIYHDGTHSNLVNSTGEFKIRANDLRLQVAAGNENYIKCVQNAAVELYYDNSKKLETFDLGVIIPGATGNLGIQWGPASNNYCNIWAEYGSGDLFLAGGLKPKTTNAGFFSSYTGNLSRNAIQVNAFGNNGIQFYASAPQVVAKDTAITVNEIARVTPNGLTFNGDSAAANALDDYEEGTWTPDLRFGGGSSGMSYNSNSRHGEYTRIGNLVTFTFRFTLTSKGSSNGSAQIYGLPFNCASGNGNYSGASFGYMAGLTNSSRWSAHQTPTIDTNASYIFLRYVITGTDYSVNHNDSSFTDATDVIARGFYYAS